MKSISRRTFIKSSIAVTAAVALQKTSIFSANATSNQKFTLEEIASYYIDPIADADSANKWMLEYSSLEYNEFDKLLDMLTDKAVKRRKMKIRMRKTA